MNAAPSSTWFTASPEWGWVVALYFFLGGIAGGCYVLAAVIDLVGRREDRPLARLGYFVSFPCVAAGGFLLTLDLGRPLRFWHMLIESNTYRPMFKYWSPMSTGALALLIFGLFACLAFAAAFDEGRNRWPVLTSARAPSGLGRLISSVGALFGFYVAGYTGVLLAVTNRPIWSDTPLLALLFIVSAASTSAAVLILAARIAGWRVPGLEGMHRMERGTIAIEFVALAALVVSLGPVVRAWLNAWGALLLVVVLLGMIVPVVLSSGGRASERNLTTSAVCVVVAGLLLRVVIVFSSGAV